MRLILNFLLFISIPFSAKAIVGLADWQEKTPNGLVINNFSGARTTIHLDNSKFIDNVEAWYFYKDFIVGFTDTTWEIIDPITFENLQNQPGYFVIQEKTKTLFTFADHSEWTKFLEKKELKPKLWTRWYRNDWSFFNDQMFIAIIFGGFIIAGPLLIVFLVFIYRMIKRDNWKMKGFNTRIVLASSTLLFVFWLIDQFPQSF